MEVLNSELIDLTLLLCVYPCDDNEEYKSEDVCSVWCCKLFKRNYQNKFIYTNINLYYLLYKKTNY